MSVSSTQYIHIIDRSAITPVLDEEFEIPFSFSGPDELIVWTIVDSLHVRKYIGGDYYILGDKIVWNGLAPSNDIRIQRHVKYNQPNRYGLTIPESVEGGLDELCIRGNQALPVDALEPLNFSSGGDRISNISDTEASDTDVGVTKSYVDNALADTSGTNTYFIDNASDVGKYLKTNTAPADPTWETINGAPSPKGKEGMYLTEGGWQQFGIIPPASGDQDNLLQDVLGVPTWESLEEFPSDDQAYGRLLSRENADPSSFPAGLLHSKWRNCGHTPTPYGQPWDCLQSSENNAEYQWKGNMSITRHYSTGSPRNSNGDEWCGVETAANSTNEINAHPVWMFSIPNPYGRVPDFLGVTIYHLTTEDYWFGAWVGTPLPGNMIWWGTQVIPPEVANIVEIDSVNIKINMSTLRHAWVKRYTKVSTSPDLFKQGNFTTTGFGGFGPRMASADRVRAFDLMWYFA